MKPSTAKAIFILLTLCVLDLRIFVGQSPGTLAESAPLGITLLIVVNGVLCLATIFLVASVWVWDVRQNRVEFRFRRHVSIGMLLPFALAFCIWTAEYFARAFGYAGPFLTASLYGVPLLLALSGFEMVGLRDGERVHPLLGAYVPSSSIHHPLPWLTPELILPLSAGLLVSSIGTLVPLFRSNSETCGLVIEATYNSTAVCIFGFGLLRILNARTFDLISSWPAFMFFFYAVFQWVILLRPYVAAGGPFAPLVFAISLLLKTCFVVSLLNILSTIRSRAKNRAKVMVSYRREDTGATTGRIYEQLIGRFGFDNVFRDIDNIPLGIVYRDYIKLVISTCAVVVVIIGKKWLDVRDQTGNRRLDNHDDLLRLEVALALERGIPVVPVAVDKASIPRKEDLPEDIQALADRNGMAVDEDPRFSSDVNRLIDGIHFILTEPHAAKTVSG